MSMVSIASEQTSNPQMVGNKMVGNKTGNNPNKSNNEKQLVCTRERNTDGQRKTALCRG